VQHIVTSVPVVAELEENAHGLPLRVFGLHPINKDKTEFTTISETELEGTTK
jgi:hypothetical protein